jgi:poly(3-hydroxybutyrate) depolymerase
MKTALMACFVAAAGAWGQVQLREQDASVKLTEGLTISGVGSWGRRTINTDALVAAMIDEDARAAFAPSSAKFDPPEAGDVLAGTEKAWSEVKANAEGAFSDLPRGSYVLVRVQSDTDRAMLLHATGNSVVYVNGEPRIGDMYGHGFVKLPVAIRRGENVLVFGHAGRGGMRAVLEAPTAMLGVIDGDITKPDAAFRVESLVPADCYFDGVGVPIYNATAAPQRVRIGKSSGSIAPMGVAKLPVATCGMSQGASHKEWNEGPTSNYEIRVDGVPTPIGSFSVKFEHREWFGIHNRTFRSEIDGSFQYVAIVRETKPQSDEHAANDPALVLSLHGASVEATSQAASYAPKPDMLIACPTNRRPFGFDWEDWGRLDALEALAFVQREYSTDPDRVYLTGHSMGGHGTWQLGVLYPEKFAAVAPSAGWLSFDSYAGARGQQAGEAEGDANARAMRGARDSSDTLNFFDNLRGRGIYILHGDADDNVPVSEARAAREKLLAMGLKEGEDFGYHEQPGAGHWWDAPVNGEDLPGAACLDWPAIFETFRKHTLSAQREARAKEQRELVVPPLDARGFPKGSFKRAFDRRFVMIYGSAGTPEENAWALAKARFDADQWWYRANGYAYVLRDDDAEVESLAKNMAHNVILYGNADTNRAWRLLMPDTIRVSRSEVRIVNEEGEQTWTGDDLGVLLAHSDGDRTIGVIAGTGLSGSRALDRMPYFLSGTGFPSQLVMRSAVWRDGMRGVLHAR